MTNDTTKEYQVHLVLNWKTGTAKVYKKPPKKLTPHEIPMHFNVTLEIPEQLHVTGDVTIKLSRAQATALLATQL